MSALQADCWVFMSEGALVMSARGSVWRVHQPGSVIVKEGPSDVLWGMGCEVVGRVWGGLSSGK